MFYTLSAKQAAVSAAIDLDPPVTSDVQRVWNRKCDILLGMPVGNTNGCCYCFSPYWVLLPADVTVLRQIMRRQIPLTFTRIVRLL